MNTKELIKLASISDINGDLELADFIDKQLLAMSENKNIREAVDLGKIFRPIGNALGKIPEFFGTGKYKAPANWTGSGIDLMTQNPNRSGNAFQRMFGSVDKEINLDANQVKELESKLLQQLSSAMDQADAPTKEVIKKIINKDFKNISSDERALLGEFARKTGIVGRRTDADFGDLADLVRGNPLQVRPRTVQRVNKNTKLLAGGAAAAMAAPGMIGMLSPQAPDVTGSEVPNGPMTGMPQLGPGMGGFGGFGGGYNGPQAGSPQGGNYEPMRTFSPNTMFDPASIQQSAGYAPASGYTGRSKEDINPAARYRSYDNMTGGESRPPYNNSGFSSQQAVIPIQTPVTPVTPVINEPSIPPVANPTAQDLVGQPGFGGATDSAGIAAELFGDQAPPEPAPLTPGQIQDALNPLSRAGY